MKIPLLAGSLLLLSLWVPNSSGYCPNEDILPCTCSGILNGISLLCKGPENKERILSVARNIETSQNLELVLESLTLDVLPESVQKATALRLWNVHMEKLSNNSTIQWPKLNDLVIESSTMLEKPWPYLKAAPCLKHLKISNIVIPRIGLDFKDGVPSAVVYLDIRKTGTAVLDSNSMSHLENLKYLLLVDMPVKHFSRDVLPLHLPHLHTFILGNTQIDHLELGFFEGMPKLEVLMLNGNYLVTLNYHTFVPVEKHLTHLLAERNPLICDCSLAWLKKKKDSINILATCKDYETGTSKEVTTLEENQYCS